jgi:hypothetical protein
MDVPQNPVRWQVPIDASVILVKLGGVRPRGFLSFEVQPVVLEIIHGPNHEVSANLGQRAAQVASRSSVGNFGQGL